MPDANEKAILQELATRVAELAAAPVQAEKRRLWRQLNALQPERPMVMIDQVCWNEMGPDLTPKCTNRDCRDYETRLRQILYQAQHWPVDAVVEPVFTVPKAIRSTGFGITVAEDIAVTDPTSAVVGHRFRNQLATAGDLDKLRVPRISHDAAETARRLALAHDLFDGILEVRAIGMEPYLTLWDPISTWMGVENVLYALVDRPAFMHRLAKRVADGYAAMLDQLEALGLLCPPQTVIHCSGGYTHELPTAGYDPAAPRTKDLWAAGLAQMFSTVSPQMFKDFEVDYVAPLFARFGLVYYGCCEPLDRKMNEVRLLPRVRKVSMSPWADEERGAAEIRGDFVFSRKPNPAFLAANRFEPDRIRDDLLRTREVCARYGCPLEFILKDISTVRYAPERLSQWAAVAMDVATGA